MSLNEITFLKQRDKYSSDINLFNRMVKYKTYLQNALHLTFSPDDIRKLKNDIRNDALIPKLIILVHDYRLALDDNEDTLFALTKSAAVILSEIDMPEYASIAGHYSFYNEYLAYASSDDADKLIFRLNVFQP